MDAKEFAKVAKSIKMPSGTVLKEKTYPGHFLLAEWTKSGGHAGATAIQRVAENARKLGFKDSTVDSTNNSDGSVMGTKSCLRNKDGVTLEWVKSYGPVKAYNYFSLTLRYDIA